MSDFLPIVVTLVVSLIGTFWDKPPKLVKGGLVLAALASAYFAVDKARSDGKDRRFLQLALTSTLSPSNSSYALLSKQIDTVAESDGFKNHYCMHSRDGMVCFLNRGSNDDAVTLVLNRNEVATLYANSLAGDDNTTIVHNLFDSEERDPRDETFKDKLGLLGLGTCTVFRDCFPELYSYDRYGVHIRVKASDTEHTVDLSVDDIGTFVQWQVRQGVQQCRASLANETPPVGQLLMGRRG